MKIWIGCDHAGYPMKLEVLAMLQEQGYTVEDMGCDGSRADYPEIAAAVGKEVAANPEDKGILICGTGIGMSIAANKIRGVRAALCADHFSAKYTRLHNDANMLAMGAGIVGENLALEIVETFLNTPFSGEERHSRRISLIEEI